MREVNKGYFMLTRYEIQEFIDACCQVLGIRSVPYSERRTFGCGEFCTLTRVIMFMKQ